MCDEKAPVGVAQGQVPRARVEKFAALRHEEPRRRDAALARALREPHVVKVLFSCL